MRATRKSKTELLIAALLFNGYHQNSKVYFERTIDRGTRSFTFKGGGWVSIFKQDSDGDWVRFKVTVSRAMDHIS
jgi:hypothetical protein